ncbi:helix-turn-helix transcriptional regulator [Amycolatopsis sp. H20-H5]|uniref:helix-turn-helix transcriptional regulator n=1 Tax=Amycolatopsis sp. H20-H5 TaxID=3046309 RepID=UPI002DBD6EE7|nr:helix-turn-helix transcriptional regulator [Amycolatopsis sp. H20-H5]MEC3980797.1 helix-turn-helix transcriptional regulator [Amycolatopsis sp. H20-H5]
MSNAYDQPTSAGAGPVDTDAVTVTTEEVGQELRRLRKAAGETQAETAKIIGVARANLTQWETGKYLPSPDNAQQLDDHFRAANALVSLVDTARSPHDRPAGPTGGLIDTSRSLAHVFRRVGDSLAGYLIRDDQGRPLGWRHKLQLDTPPTTLSTAYGLCAMVVVGEPYIDLHRLAGNLYELRSELGWQARSGGRRPETTAAAVDALSRVGIGMSADEGLGYLESSLDAFSRTRPYLLSTVLQVATRLRPEAPLTTRLIDDLLATRLDFQGSLLWTEKNEEGLVAPEASVAHTARAVVALREVLHSRDDRHDVREAIDDATQWLIERTHPDDGMYEELIRPRPDGVGSTRIIIRHFTPAWIVQALAGAPHLPVDRLNRALLPLWERYEAGLGLWTWGSGDVPIWLTLDAVTALRAAALAVATPPVSPPGE